MSSNAALSAARRRRSNPVNAPSTTNTQSHNPPANRILQRTGPGGPAPTGQRPPPPQLNQRMAGPPHLAAQKQQQQQQQQQQMRQPPLQSQAQGRAPMGRLQSPLPPLPPPVKGAGPLYGIPLHPLLMFKTHDNKLNEHDLSIGDCFEQLKEFEDRLASVESVKSDEGALTDASGIGAGDLNELMNDGVFINGVVDNIMNTTNFASIIDNIIPLKEENEMLKQQVNNLFEKMRQLEDRLNLVCVSSKFNHENAEKNDPNSIEVGETLCAKDCDDVVEKQQGEETDE
jgi:hypothetical protein